MCRSLYDLETKCLEKQRVGEESGERENGKSVETKGEKLEKGKKGEKGKGRFASEISTQTVLIRPPYSFNTLLLCWGLVAFQLQ